MASVMSLALFLIDRVDCFRGGKSEFFHYNSVFPVFSMSCTERDAKIAYHTWDSKILTTVVSTFSAYYISLWPSFFPSINLTPPLPSFDGRLVEYPRLDRIQDYLRWRQVDCHINNLYNTTFWALVDKGGLSATEAEERLKGTVARDKNEILFSRFGTNYNNEEEMFRKGSVLYRMVGLNDCILVLEHMLMVV